MNFLARLIAAILGITIVVLAVPLLPAMYLIPALVGMAGTQVFMARHRGIRNLLLRFVPILLFAVTIWLVQVLAGDPSPRLAIQALLVFATALLLTPAATARRVPMPKARPLFRLYLFAHFVRHFTEILDTETKRVLIAREIAAPKLRAAGGMRSLVHSLIAVFLRAITRAERFYAAQTLRGLDA